ncbi:hypothetical protein [Nonomuraea africana]|uniref:hypothetical protein n=1 Tax=Nonomuraea africana TaxID=46171 RepID=UPI003411155D
MCDKAAESWPEMANGSQLALEAVLAYSNQMEVELLMSLRSPDKQPPDTGGRKPWRLVMIGGFACVTTIAVAVQPAWAIPLGVGLTAATVLGGLLRGGNKTDD